MTRSRHNVFAIVSALAPLWLSACAGLSGTTPGAEYQAPSSPNAAHIVFAPSVSGFGPYDHPQTRMVPRGNAAPVHSTGTIPGFYLSATDPTDRKTIVLEYSASAGLDTPPLRVLHIDGRVIGVDAAGDIVTTNTFLAYRSCAGSGPCFVRVYSYAGSLLRRLYLAPAIAGYVGSDAAGRIYVESYGRKRIAVYPPGASGNATPPSKVLKVDLDGLSPTQVRTPIYVDAAGNIFVRGYTETLLHGRFAQSPTVTEFAANAQGATSPLRKIRSPRISGGVQAIGKSGNLWTSNGSSVAYIYGKAARGVIPPSWQVALPAPTNAITLDSKGDIAYVTPNLCEIQVVKPGSTAPFQRIRLQKYCDFDLFAVTF